MSINASNGQETGILGVIDVRCYPHLSGLMGSVVDTSDYYAKNAGTVGINPQDSTKTRVD